MEALTKKVRKTDLNRRVVAYRVVAGQRQYVSYLDPLGHVSLTDNPDFAQRFTAWSWERTLEKSGYTCLDVSVP
ncbi:MAG: hypothetical protein AAGI08_16630 [Bacteroidota bacterium]